MKQLNRIVSPCSCHLTLVQAVTILLILLSLKIFDYVYVAFVKPLFDIKCIFQNSIHLGHPVKLIRKMSLPIFEILQTWYDIYPPWYKLLDMPLSEQTSFLSDSHVFNSTI